MSGLSQLFQAAIDLLETMALEMENAPDGEALPPLIPIEDGCCYENPIQHIDMEWDSVDVHYVEQVALNLYQHYGNFATKRLQSNVVTKRVVETLKTQDKHPMIHISLLCCSNPDCNKNMFAKCVLDACGLIFQETQYF